MQSTVYSLPSTSPLVVIVGETASGKSALALELAKQFDGEIVSADSWQVYKEFDIGTAKPGHTEQNQVSHHLIGVANATDGFNAALYKDLAKAAIADIQSRSKVPILAGGTGLYVDSVLFDFGFLPTVSPEERERRNKQSLEDLLAEAKSMRIDLEGIDTRNKRRVIRALETDGQRPLSNTLRPNTLIIGTQSNRDDLRQKISQRIDAMLAEGLEQEARALSQKYGWDAEPMKGIGYREWQLYFEGKQTLEQTRERIISSSMDLAKRQRTWFKRNKAIQWIDGPREAVDLVTTFLNT